MSGESGSLAAPDTIAGVAARIDEWIKLGAPGIIWIRHFSEISRDLLLARLSEQMQVQRIDFRPPDPPQAATWLEVRLNAATEGEALTVVAVLFPPSLGGALNGGASDRVLEAFRSLNLWREPLARLPLIQLWFAPLAIAHKAELEAPDLASWFRIKMTLAEAIFPEAVGPAEAAIISRWQQESRSLETLKDIVERQRKLVESAGHAYLAELASGLTHLSVKLAEEGHRQEAERSAEEAVRIYRQLAQQQPSAFLPHLAGSLNNLASDLATLGRPEEGLPQAEEAVQICRQLSREAPDAHLPDLARSVNTRAMLLSLLGRREEALRQTEEAVGIYRQLAQQRPDAFLPALAGSLSNLATALGGIGRPEEALSPAEESVRIYRQLSQQRTDAFLPGLAKSLSNSAILYSRLSRLVEALDHAEEAVRIRRRLASEHPDAFLPDLTRALGVAGKIALEISDNKIWVKGVMESLADGIHVLTPFFVRLPEAYAPLMHWIRDLYLQAAQAAGVEPDPALLAPKKCG
ncbi:MAG TPA: tetratricopeptide repeat protein [Bryobacteraceae bacterium]